MTTILSSAQSEGSSSVYPSSHDPTTLRTHEWRTVENSVAYLVHYLKPDMKILDVGCGPGSITIDLARYVPDGFVVGIEFAHKPLSAAHKLAQEKNVSNVQFEHGDALKLHKYADNSFDLVHVHQVLQHVPDPVRALREMRRVTKPGGIVAAREIAAMTWYPRLPELDHWHDLYLKVATFLGGNPYPGARIHVWAQEAGFTRESITCSAGTWCFSTREERKWWSNIWTERVTTPTSVENSVEKGKFCTEKDLFNIANGWDKWGRDKNGWFTTTLGEIICRKEADDS